MFFFNLSGTTSLFFNRLDDGFTQYIPARQKIYSILIKHTFHASKVTENLLRHVIHSVFRHVLFEYQKDWFILGVSCFNFVSTESTITKAFWDNGNKDCAFAKASHHFRQEGVARDEISISVAHQVSVDVCEVP